MKIKVHWCSVVSFCLSLVGIPIKGASTTVDISNSAFLPPNVEIRVGDTVTWSNSDFVPHTATANDSSWDTGFLNNGQSATLTFNTPGTFDYFCGVHPFMTARLIVQAPQAAPPTVSITSPLNNTTLTQPGTVTMDATAAADPTAQITQVEFFVNGISAGVDSSAPYSVSTNLATGTHSLTARATDNKGAFTTSTAIIVTVQAGGAKIEDPIVPRLPKGTLTIELRAVVTNLISPLGMAVPNDGSKRQFVYDQAGLIYIFTNGIKLTEPLLDVRSRMVNLNPNYDERGLLGLATHPDFANQPFIYTYTSEPNGPPADFQIVLGEGKINNHQSVIAEWRIDATNTNRIDPTSRREILRLDKPQSNHNGGTLRFGPDGFLYVAIGDGGASDDQGDGHTVPGGNGQDKSKILGKLIRIDVNARSSPNGQYGVPQDNPFVGQTAANEIYALGLRNPFSFTFDSQTGNLWLADVGQNDVEEINLVTKGANLGWPIKEGSFFFDQNGGGEGFVSTAPVLPVPSDLVNPVAEYDHDEGQAVIGGYVYRGNALTNLQGIYVTGDWGMFGGTFGRLFYLEGQELKEFRIGSADRGLGMFLKGFGQDADGELYVFGTTTLGPSGTTGRMFKIVSTTVSISEITRDGNSITIRWTGGVGPFQVQKKTSLSDPTWTNAQTVSENSIVLPIEGDTGFFQVLTQ